MRAIALPGFVAFATGIALLSSLPARPQSQLLEDRELDCRNPRDIPLCREIQRSQTGISNWPNAYRPPSPPSLDRAISGNQQADARGADPNSLTIDMSVSATATNPPVIMGMTNLPEGTVLNVHLLGDPPACVPRCGQEYNAATVHDGRFVTTIKGTEPLLAASYTIEITTPMAGFEPPNVQAVIGKSGEHLRGPYVVTLGSDGKYVPLSSAQNSVQSITGFMIRYTKRVRIF
jgi:hypothetical protein